jgi:hypothetical protein
VEFVSIKKELKVLKIESANGFVEILNEPKNLSYFYYSKIK